MTNLDRLADSDLLMQGFLDLVRSFLRARVRNGLKGVRYQADSNEYRGDAPESLRQFYELWIEVPQSQLGDSIGMHRWQSSPNGFFSFANMSTNWELGLIRNPDADSSCPNHGWEVWAHSENDGQWRPLPGVRLDFLLVEAGLMSLFSLPLGVRVFGEDQDAASRWEQVLTPTQPVWTGKFEQVPRMPDFEYASRQFRWDPGGILLRTETQEYGFPREDGSRATLPFRYATFTSRDTYDRFIELPGCRRNDTGYLTLPVE